MAFLFLAVDVRFDGVDNAACYSHIFHLSFEHQILMRFGVAVIDYVDILTIRAHKLLALCCVVSLGMAQKIPELYTVKVNFNYGLLVTLFVLESGLVL